MHSISVRYRRAKSAVRVPVGPRSSIGGHAALGPGGVVEGKAGDPGVSRPLHAHGEGRVASRRAHRGLAATIQRELGEGGGETQRSRSWLRRPRQRTCRRRRTATGGRSPSVASACSRRLGQHAVRRSLTVKREGPLRCDRTSTIPPSKPVNGRPGRCRPALGQGRGRLAGSDFARTGGGCP
jgi:hypothetical protein